MNNHESALYDTRRPAGQMEGPHKARVEAA